MVNNPNSVSEHGGGLTGIVNGSVDIAAVPAIVASLLQSPEAAQYVMSSITDSALSPEKFATIKAIRSKDEIVKIEKPLIKPMENKSRKRL